MEPCLRSWKRRCLKSAQSPEFVPSVDETITQVSREVARELGTDVECRQV